MVSFPLFYGFHQLVIFMLQFSLVQYNKDNPNISTLKFHVHYWLIIFWTSLTFGYFANNSFTGKADLSDLLSSLDDQIVKAKEEAQSRKEILEKVEKWQYASEEEKWLDEYEKVIIVRNLSIVYSILISY